MKTKAKDQIRKSIDELADSEINMASEYAREILTDKIYSELTNGFHIFRKNELIVKNWCKEREDDWRIKQYNRNREIKDHVSTIEEMEERVAKSFDMPDNYGVDQGGAYEINKNK
jgi:hypothetical protein